MCLNDLLFLYTARLHSSFNKLGQAGVYQQPYQLPCNHPSRSVTERFWQYNGKGLVLGQRVTMLRNGTLNFLSMNFEDAGLYICYAKSLGTPYWISLVRYDLSVFGKCSSATYLV